MIKRLEELLYVIIKIDFRAAHMHNRKHKSQSREEDFWGNN